MSPSQTSYYGIRPWRDVTSNVELLSNNAVSSQIIERGAKTFFEVFFLFFFAIKCFLQLTFGILAKCKRKLSALTSSTIDDSRAVQAIQLRDYAARCVD